MIISIFDVEHGACALITADNGSTMMIDCGHNATTQWKPGTHLKNQKITALDLLAITNYDEDHASGAADLFDNTYVKWLQRNKSVSPEIIKNLKSEDGMGPGIDRLVQEIESNFNGASGAASSQPIFEGVERQVFYNTYPAFEDENNLSMVVFLKCHGIGFMFPGDLESIGCDKLLEDPQFKKALTETHVLIAPHHGRENGCWTSAVPYLKNVYYVVISDKGYTYDTQKTLPFYTPIAKGGPFRREQRKVLTTRNDGTINFTVKDGQWFPY